MTDSWVFTLGGVHLVNRGQGPVKGGDPRGWHSTPFGVRDGWTPTVAKPTTLWQGGGPFSNGERPAVESYRNVSESIPISVVGGDADEVATALASLGDALSGASLRTPIVWRHRPHGATHEAYAEVYSAFVQPITNDAVGPIEGGADLEATIELVRSPFFGSDSLHALLAAEAVTNGASGNVFDLGDLLGDMQREGQPLNYSLAKPASGIASTVYLATVASRTNKTITGTLSAITNTTTGSAYSASGSIDVSELRAQFGLSARVLGRFTTLTNPSVAEAQAEIQTAGGARLWLSQWVRLGSDATAQLVDFGAATLDMLRVPLPSAVAANVKIVVRLRSSSGTAVTATLDYIDLLLAHDFCAVVSSGLASGERLLLSAAQNLSGGGWLPLPVAGALILDGSDVATKPARVHGSLPRAFTGCSLFVAWLGANGSHTKTDTSAISVDHAPLWRSLRGLS